MTNTELDDLFRRVADGDRSAVEPAFRLLWPIVRRYCASKTRDESCADDAAQSTLVKMFEQAVHYDPTKPAIAWALALAYWECRTQGTRDRRELVRAGETTPDDHGDPAPHPEAAFSDAEATRLALQLLAELPPEERALLEGNEEGLGDTLQALAPAARRKRKQRLLEQLRSAWNEILRPGAKQ